MIAIGLGVLALAIIIARLDLKHSYPFWVDALLGIAMVVGALAILGGVLIWLWERAP